MMRLSKFSGVALAILASALPIHPVIALAHGIPEADKHAMLAGAYWQYVPFDASHMLTGHD